MFGGRLGSSEIIILAVLLIVIFGWKRLPDAARSLGRSARVFKSEVDEMKNDGKDKKSETVPGETVPGGTVPGEPVRREADVDPTTVQGTTPISEDAPRTDNVSGEQTGDAHRKIV